MPPRRRRSHAPRRANPTQSWLSLVAFLVALLLILMFNRMAGDRAAGCFSTVSLPAAADAGPDAAAADAAP